jgi:hypothetical protein
MALDAFVMCRCWQDRRTSPPPLPADQIAVDDGYLNPTLPYQGDENLYVAFDQWRRQACEHERMHAADERIANVAGYAFFQETLARAGWEHFPVLDAELPHANGGTMPADAAARVLEELRYLTARADLGELTQLRDAESGDAVWTYINAYEGVMVRLGAETRIGADPAGFFVWDDTVDPPAEVFRAMTFSQRHAGGTGRDLRVEFSDGDRRVVVRVGHHLIGGDETTGPERLEVVTRPVNAPDLAFVVGPLSTVCRAAVETGNPVVWC